MSDYERIEKVILYLETHYLEQPSLEKLAKVAGLSESHFHRMFTKWARITPKDFLKFLTAKHAKAVLNDSQNLLTTSHEAGLSGPGRLHDLFVTVEAVTPYEYKTKGQGVEIEYGFHKSPFGKYLLGTTKRGICFLSFHCDLEELKNKWANATIKKNQKSTAAIAKKLFQPESQEEISVLVMGTSFQVKVWEALLRIPEGHLLSYKGLASMIGAQKAARAVGSAVASNTIGFLIPCHRVIRDTGKFSEYRWDPIRKKAIIAWESGQKSN